MKHGARVGVVLGGLATILTLLVGVAAANPETFQAQRSGFTLGVSGPVDLRDVNYGTGVTECPQAGRSVELPAPLDRRRKDAVEELSGQGDDRRANQDYSCFPHDEMSISANPQDGRNLVGGANDYRLGWGTSGFYASTDGGRNWYDGIIPFPSLPGGDNLDGGGDPAIVHDRAGLVYYADINFNRTDDTNGVWVSRSTNGGFTWSRPCVALAGAAPSDDVATCGGIGDPRLPGDGTIAYLPDGDALANSSIAFNDKEYIAAGPRPAGVSPTCFRPETKTAFACPPEITGVDRIYVTWTLFSQRGDPSPGSRIYVSYSDDQARSWSPPRAISGSAPFCVGSAASECAFNQGSVPTVHPATGALYVSFLNGNTPDEDQYLVVRSLDGGQSFTGPRFVTPIFDVNYPRAVNGRRDCVTRGQGSTRAVLTNSCFRVNSYGNITVDKRGGAFADDIYVVIDDNRNGTIKSSDVDVFLFKSTNGGDTWIGPTRVNDDPTLEPSGSKAPGTSWANTPPGFDRDCGRDPESISGDASKCTVDPVGNDQFFP
nr:exo-alpha-sialidase [Actinomycetota bacterium]